MSLKSKGPDLQGVRGGEMFSQLALLQEWVDDSLGFATYYLCYYGTNMKEKESSTLTRSVLVLVLTCQF